MPNSDTDALATRIEQLAAPVAEELGASIYDVEVRRHGSGGTVRLIVDRAGAHVPGEGITVGEVTRIAKEVGYLLDAEDAVPFSYTFEVSSPGIERPLRAARHYAQNVGEEVRLVLADQLADGTRVVEGLLEGFAEGVARVTGADGVVREVRIENVRRGRTVFDFDSRKSNKK